MAEQNLGKMVIEISAKLDRLDAQLKTAESKTAAAGSKMESAFKNVAGAVGLAFGTGQIIEFGKEAVLLAAKMEGIKQAFDRINSVGLLDNLRKATRGTVSDLVLMQNAVRANNFQIPVQQLGTLFEFAGRRAKETGGSVDYLVESITTGISRKSIMILDNLGISATRLKDAMGGAALESKSVGEVAAAVAGIAREEMDKAGASVDTTGDKIDRLRVKWENFLASVGKFGGPVLDGFVQFIGDLETIYGWFSAINAIGDVGTNNLPNNVKSNLKMMPAHASIVAENKKQALSYGEVKAKIDELTKAQDALVFGSKKYLAVEKEITKLQESVGLETGPGRRSPSEIKEVFYNGMKTKAEGYYAWELKQIEKQVADFRRARVSEVEIEAWKIDQLTKMTDDFMKERERPAGEGGGSVAADKYMAEQVMREFDQGYKREELDAAAKFEESFNLAPMEARDSFNTFWEEQGDSVDKFGDSLAGAFRRGGNEGAAGMVEMMRVAMKIAAIVASMNAGKTGGAEGGFGIFGTLLSLVAMHGGGTVVNSGGRIALGQGFASGVDFVVPPGYAKDSYPMRVESGERVTVTPVNGVSGQERALQDVLAGIRVLNYNMITAPSAASAQPSDGRVEVYGMLGGKDIYLSSEKSKRVYGRTR